MIASAAWVDTPPAWFVVLPDCDAAAAVLSNLGNGRVKEVRHPSGRPWILGRWSDDTLAVGRAGRNSVAVLGQHAATVDALNQASDRLSSVRNLDRLSRSLTGSFHLLASIDGHVRVQGSVTCTRRVYHARFSGVSIASDR